MLLMSKSCDKLLTLSPVQHQVPRLKTIALTYSFGTIKFSSFQRQNRGPFYAQTQARPEHLIDAIYNIQIVDKRRKSQKVLTENKSCYVDQSYSNFIK